MQTFAVNCTLAPSPQASNTDVRLDQIAAELARHDVPRERARDVGKVVVDRLRALTGVE